jgi:hypothetical protein
MKKDSYVQAYKDAKAELSELTSQRDELEQRIARLKQFIVSIQPFVAEERDIDRIHERLYGSDTGLKDMCLEIIKAATGPLSSSEIVPKLRVVGFDIDKYSNPIAVVVTTLGRLAHKGDIIEERKEGIKVYRMPTHDEKLKAIIRKSYKEVKKGKK